MRQVSRAIVAGVAASVVVAASAAQTHAEPTAVSRAHGALMHGRYLEAIDRLRAAAFAPEAEREPGARGLWAQVHPFIGGVSDPAVLGEGHEGPLSGDTAERLRRADVRDAIGEIVARARGTRIVILNEAHDMPRDRAFALELARALRPLGFDILAAEALSNGAGAGAVPPVEQLARDGFPRLGTGFYTLDPVFGDFLRQALALGYRPVAYESVNDGRVSGREERIAAREQEQAENLARIVRDNPEARLLVFVGYSHAIEAPVEIGGGRTREWMASRLKRLTGIDPLTVDQTVFDEANPLDVAHRNLISKRIGRRPGVLYLEGRPLIEGRAAGAHDLQVVHPPLRLRRGRPDWMWRIGRRPVAVPSRLLPRQGRRLIQAFVAGEPGDAIPLDQIVVEAGRAAPPLMVPRDTRIRWAWQDPLPIG